VRRVDGEKERKREREREREREKQKEGGKEKGTREDISSPPSERARVCGAPTTSARDEEERHTRVYVEHEGGTREGGGERTQFVDLARSRKGGSWSAAIRGRGRERERSGKGNERERDERRSVCIGS